MQLAGKYGIGVLSIASTSTEGLQALPTQWGFAEEAAAKHGQTVDRTNWRVLMALAPRRDRRSRPSRKPSTGCSTGTTSTTSACSAGPGADARRRPVGAAGPGDRHGADGAGTAVDRHARRAGRDDPQPAGGHRRLRRRARLRARLGQPGGDAALVGPLRPLRHPRDQRLHAQPEGVGRVPGGNKAELMAG